jgi:hypothetical protein
MKLAGALLVILASFASAQGRVAVSHDGNYHDKDDIGAIAMVQALVWKAGAQASLVHLDHSSHIGANSPEQHSAMVISANRALWLYGIDPTRVFDDFLDLQSSIQSLAGHINASSADDRLTILQAGPWEVMARAFDLADPQRHQFVDIISHSVWNDTYKAVPSHRDRNGFFAQYEPGDQFAGTTRPGYIKITDQNWTAFNLPLHDWAWMEEMPETRFVLWRTMESDYAAGDMSDAGMMFYYLTGIEHPTMQDIQNFFAR